MRQDMKDMTWGNVLGRCNRAGGVALIVCSLMNLFVKTVHSYMGSGGLY